MWIIKEFFVLMMVHAIAASEFEQPPQFYCHQNVFNQIRGIEMKITTVGFPQNFNSSQIQKLGEFLVCCHFNNGFTDNAKNFQGVISLEQLRNQFMILIDLVNSFENYNDNFTNFLNDLHQLNIFENQKIHFSIEFHPLNRTINQQNLQIKLILQQSQESNFEKGFENKLHQQFGGKFSLTLTIIHQLIFCGIIAFLQSFKIQIIKEFINEFRTYTDQQCLKVLIFPVFFQIIIDITFYYSFMFEFEFVEIYCQIIYFLPIGLQLWILNLNSQILINLILKKKWAKKISENKCYFILFIFANYALTAFICVLFAFISHDNIYYQYCLPYIYLPQIIYNFKFHKLELSWKIFFTNLDANIFFIVYSRSLTLSVYNIDFNLWVSLIDCSAFLIQSLIFYLQNRYGPKVLILKCKQWRKKKPTLLYEQDEEICSICLAGINDINCSQNVSGIVVTICQHKFHYSCLWIWIEVQKFCPLCRKEINKSIFE